jgi:YegS/Rv2252/BmrU family lipid kinase
MFVMMQLLAQGFNLFGDGTHRGYTQEIATYRQPVLIYNPAAGRFRRSPVRLLQRTIAALKNIGIEPTPLATDAAGHASELARTAVGAGADLVLVLGGDGTINEVANGMIPSHVPLGVLPGGTANVLCNELGLGNRVEYAAKRLGDCIERRISVGRCCGSNARKGEAGSGACLPRYFLMMGGVGLDAYVVTKVNLEWKARAGKLAYWAAGLGEFFRPVRQFQATINGTPQQCGFALVSRVRNYGGDLQIAGGASLLRDDFEVVLFEGSNGLQYAGYMLTVILGQVQSVPGVRTLRTARVDFSGEGHLQFDGEYGGQLPVKFETVPEALTLLVPPEYR